MSLDDFTFAGEWDEIVERTGERWVDVYESPVKNARVVQVVYEVACRRLGFDDAVERAAALSAGAAIRSFSLAKSTVPAMGADGVPLGS